MARLFIKNMVCARCTRTVERLFAEAGAPTGTYLMQMSDAAGRIVAVQRFFKK